LSGSVKGRSVCTSQTRVALSRDVVTTRRSSGLNWADKTLATGGRSKSGIVHQTDFSSQPLRRNFLDLFDPLPVNDGSDFQPSILPKAASRGRTPPMKLRPPRLLKKGHHGRHRHSHPRQPCPFVSEAVDPTDEHGPGVGELVVSSEWFLGLGRLREMFHRKARSDSRIPFFGVVPNV
jgi:hypothetical protein